MKYAGVDLHKKSISVCVVSREGKRMTSRRFGCNDPEKIVEFFRGLGDFEFVVEATGSYEWFMELIQPLAQRAVLAHATKVRIIAESMRKTDKFDAYVLAWLLSLDVVPEAYRPNARQREHRRLVRHRSFIQKRIGAVKNKMRRILSDYNADFPGLFEEPLAEVLKRVKFSDADTFVLQQLAAELSLFGEQLQATEKALKEFAKKADALEAQHRKILQSIPQVATVTTEVVLSELAGPQRFRSQKAAVSYAGLVPGIRASDGKSKELHIEKAGSPLLRWVLIEAAWRLVQRERMWRVIFENLARRKGRKKAIVAVARRLLAMMIGLMHRGEMYDARHISEAGWAIIWRNRRGRAKPVRTLA